MSGVALHSPSATPDTAIHNLLILPPRLFRKGY
nr:MAG TPA: hypothetical protein [Herelleviridae sp.]